MMNQWSSNEKRTNMWNQIVRSASNQGTKFVGFTLQTCDFAPLTRWRRELRKGVFKNTCFVEDLQRACSETPDRSSGPEVFCQKGVLRNFAKFTGKHLC